MDGENLRRKSKEDNISAWTEQNKGGPRPFYVVFQIIGSYFCLSDIKNQTISFFVSFLRHMIPLPKISSTFDITKESVFRYVVFFIKTLLDNLLLVASNHCNSLLLQTNRSDATNYK